MTIRRPRDLRAGDLVLSHFSLARQHPIHERVALAARHGFAGIGLYLGHYRQLEADGFAPGGLRDLLDEHGVCLAEIEVVRGLGADGPGGPAVADDEAVAFRMAEEFGCRYLQVIGPGGASVAEAGRAYGALCDRAADHGLVVGIEFLPFTDITSVVDARAIVEAAGRPNGGICVDIWHHERGLRSLAAISELPGEMITAIQFSDGTIQPAIEDYYSDCLVSRRPPGQGEFDLVGFLETVRATGTTVPIGLEVCSEWGWAHPDEHVAAIAAGMAALPLC